ncbi:serine protease [Arenimonas sp.]|uniref:trypsin-like serine peptidase n=1 Tax=Arenimonas sp. TaxID=1872635 RepID=UPI0035AEA6C2
MNSRTPLALALALAMGSTAAWAEAPLRVEGERALATKVESSPAWVMPELAESQRAVVTLPALPAEKIRPVQRRNERSDAISTQIGVARENDVAPRPALKWLPAAGGQVARLDVRSTDALAMRVGLDISALPDNATLRFAGDLAPDQLLEVSVAQAKSQLADGVYWSPVTDGELQSIEIFVPAGVAVKDLAVGLPTISHLLTNSFERFNLAKGIGTSGACNVNAICRVGTLGQGYVNAKDAVARMVFTEGGQSFTCTGTLLNDTAAGTQIPYFYSADHCISTQTVASTLNTFWNFESTSCGSNVQAATVQRSGGATYLYSSGTTDALLLRLNDAPPAGAYFAGWDANPLANNANVVAIHHPDSDLKKSSLGQKKGEDAEVHYVGWSSGTTEGGSSGSGLFVEAGGAYLLRGGLWGGTASCANSGTVSNPDNSDYYSRLDVVYPNIQQYLSPAAQGNGPSAGRDYTGAWYVPSESGWGMTVYQYAAPTYNQFVLFFIYDGTGKAQWFELDSTWTATDVRSGTVYASNAAPWTTTYNPANRAFTAAGNASITYTSATTANLQLTVNGVTRNVALQKL